MLRLREIEQGMLAGAVRLLQRAAGGEDIRTEAKRFVVGLEDPGGKPVERVYLTRPA
jgi:hypothetical protein